MRSRPAQPKSRDYFLKALILGSCKGGAHTNHKHRANALACRNRKKETMPAAVLAHAPKTNVVADWERDTDLYRIYANIEDEEGWLDVDIVEIHLLDESLQTAAVVNDIMFTDEEWDSIEDAAMNEWRRQNPSD